MSVNDFDFATLNREANAESWNNTFAYWLLVLHNPNNSYAQYASELQTIMSFQFDAEEQAEAAEDVASDDSLIPTVFIPVAPVTLALRWSPFPTATRILGSPLHSHTYEGSALAVFTPKIIVDSTGTTVDEQHFDFLLRETCARAVAADALVLLAGSPGWSYKNEDDHLASRLDVQQLMRTFGFVYTLRRPAGIY